MTHLPDYDVVVIGAGIVGLTCAALLKTQTELRIAIVISESNSTFTSATTLDGRVSALTHRSFEILQSLQITNQLQIPGQFNQIHVWDFNHHFINFNRNQLLGYVVNNQNLKSCLLSYVKTKPNLTCIDNNLLKKIEREHLHVKLSFQTGDCCTTSLVIGSDGADSTVRTLNHMISTVKDYQQNALVTAISHSNTHANIAKQFFLKTGPLGLLPLADPMQTAIVWSANPLYIQTLSQLSCEDFKAHLEYHTHSQLGPINQVGTCYCYPLFYRHSQCYVKENIALIGDAAHSIHPLAGQGLNLGLSDCQCLVETIIRANRMRRPIGARYSLRPYERQRKFHNQLMIKSIHIIQYWFDPNTPYVQKWRAHGLKFLQRIKWLKQWIMYYASG